MKKIKQTIKIPLTLFYIFTITYDCSLRSILPGKS